MLLSKESEKESCSYYFNEERLLSVTRRGIVQILKVRAVFVTENLR